MDYKEIIDKLVRELSYRVGIPNVHNKEHQSIMSEILSEWGEYDVKQTIFEFLTEKDKEETFTAKNKESGETAVFKSKESRDNAIEAGTHEPIDKKDDDDTQTTQGSAVKPGSDFAKKNKERLDRVNKEKEDDESDSSEVKPKDTKKSNNKTDKTPKSTLDRTNFDKKDDKKYKDNPGGPTRKEIYDDLNNGNIDVLSEYQDGVSINRTKRISGAGGKKASEGESKFCGAVDTNFEKWEEDNKQTIDRVQIKIKNRSKTADENRTAIQLGMDVDSPEFNRYLAKREIWVQQKIEENKETLTFVKDFSRNKKTKENPMGPYTEWMNAAFDGGIQTQKHIKKLDIFDLSKPHKTIQSTTEVDEAVQAHLEDNLKNAKTDEDKAHAKKQLKNWNKYKSYHDTYIIGKDKKGRTTYFGISNKKGPLIHSIFSTAKTFHKDIKEISGLEKCSILSNLKPYDKEIFFFNEHFKKQLPIQARLTGILHIIQSDDKASITLTSAANILSIVGSTSITMFPYSNQTHILQLMSLFKSVPCFKFELGNQVNKIASKLKQFLKLMAKN